MFKGLSGKHAIVTGGSTLIGAGLVEAFVKAGATVTIADIDAERGQAIADACGKSAWFSQTDISDDAQLESCVAESAKKFGRIDFVVNAACVYVDDGINASH